MRRFYRLLLPRGDAWKLPGSFGAFVDGTANVYNYMKLWIDGVFREMTPGTADDDIEKWYKQLGIGYNPQEQLHRKQSRASQVYTSVGGQSYSYVLGQVRRSFPEIEIEMFFDGGGLYDPECHIRVTGDIQNVFEVQRLNDIMIRVLPARVIPVYDVDIEALQPAAETGFAITGLAMTGRARE